MNKKLRITGYIGLIASLLMYAGDMLLYFTAEPFQDYKQELLPSMGNVPFDRLAAGGIIGPLSACLYAIGFYHIYLAVRKAYKKTARVMLVAFCASLMFGGAFHAFFPAFGIVSAAGHPELIEPLHTYADRLGSCTMGLMLAAWILFLGLVLGKRTHYPRWIILATPWVSMWLMYLWVELPQPFQILIAGGWSNLMSTIFFAFSLIALRKKNEE